MTEQEKTMEVDYPDSLPDGAENSSATTACGDSTRDSPGHQHTGTTVCEAEDSECQVSVCTEAPVAMTGSNDDVCVLSPGENDAPVKALPIDSEQLVKAMPVDSEQLVKAMPVDSEQLVKALPVDSQQLVKALPVDCQQLVKAMPVDCQQLVKAMPVDCQQLVKAMPVDSQQLVKAMPVDCQQLVKAMPVDSQQLVKAMPVDSQQLVKAMPVDCQQLVKAMPVDCQQLVKAMLVDCQQLVKAMPVDSQQLVKAMPLPVDSQQLVKAMPVDSQQLANVDASNVTPTSDTISQDTGISLITPCFGSTLVTDSHSPSIDRGCNMAIISLQPKDTETRAVTETKGTTKSKRASDCPLSAVNDGGWSAVSDYLHTPAASQTEVETVSVSENVNVVEPSETNLTLPRYSQSQEKTESESWTHVVSVGNKKESEVKNATSTGTAYTTPPQCPCPDAQPEVLLTTDLPESVHRSDSPDSQQEEMPSSPALSGLLPIAGRGGASVQVTQTSCDTDREEQAALLPAAVQCQRTDSGDDGRVLLLNNTSNTQSSGCLVHASLDSPSPDPQALCESSVGNKKPLAPGDSGSHPALATVNGCVADTGFGTDSPCNDTVCTLSGLSLSSTPVTAVETSDKETGCADTSTVRIKEEPSDTGYEQALTASRQRPHQSISSAQLRQITKAASSQNASTTVIRNGKKRVKVTIIRGEWRTPSKPGNKNTTPSQAKPGKKQDNMNITPRQNPVSGTITRRSSRIQRSSAMTASEPSLSMSAVPVALYRNAHIKTEPHQHGYPDCQPASSVLTTSLSRPATVSPRPRPPQTAAPSQAWHVSPSLFSKKGRGWRGQERRPPQSRAAAASSASAGQLEDQACNTAEALSVKMQNCSVQLQGLPADVLTSGRVNCAMDPQILQNAAAVTIAAGMRKRPRDGKRPWECERCGKCYKTKSARTQHYKVHDGLREHICSLCGAAFTYKSVLTAHYRFVHYGEKPHCCSVCGKKFAWSSHLSVHLQLHYEGRSHTCPICHQQFYSAYIKTHLATHSHVRQFHCDLCDRQYKSKRALQMHQMVHSGHKPYNCSKCSQQFAYKNSLTIHLRTHTGERPYPCQHCPSTFTQSTHLRTHMKGVHKITNPPNRRKRREVVERVETCTTDSGKDQRVSPSRPTLGKAGHLDKSLSRQKLHPAIPIGKKSTKEDKFGKVTKKSSISEPGCKEVGNRPKFQKRKRKHSTGRHQAYATVSVDDYNNADESSGDDEDSDYKQPSSRNGKRQAGRKRSVPTLI